MKAPEQTSQRVLSYSGTFGSARGLVLARLLEEERSLLVFTPDRKSADELSADFSFFSPHTPLYTLMGWETLPYEEVSPAVLVSSERIRALHALRSGERCVIIATAEGATQLSLTPQMLSELTFTLSQGSQADRITTEQKLDLCGFSRVSLVEEVGEMAVRGGVIDFFPSGSQRPIRIEFLNNTIESIREFEPETQRSATPRPAVTILPVRESISFTPFSPYSSLLHSAQQRIRDRGKELGTPPREIQKIIEALEHGTRLPGIELFEAIALETRGSVFDFCQHDQTFVVDDQIALSNAIDRRWEILEEREQARAHDHFLIPERGALDLSPDQIQERLHRHKTHYLNRLELHDETTKSVEHINLNSRSNIELSTRLKTKVGSGSALEPLERFLSTYRRQGYRVAFVVGAKARIDRLQKLLLDYSIDAPAAELDGLDWIERAQKMPVAILPGHISSGVILPEDKIIFLSESEIFGERSYRRGPHAGQAVTKKILNSLSQLSEGDYVVHTDYGIGIYRGIKHLDVAEATSDFLQIDYADSRLYLPVQNIGRVQKFSAAEGERPTLDKLASNRWKNTKIKVRQSVVSLAGELIKLYAARSVAKGWRYEPYGSEDDRFADGFAFNETPDQLKAIEETVADMALDKPMDRLVCGDVGFGKTEVALRAAFKCTQHARQVAVLVPTTILVEQHAAQFRARFAEYPVKVGAVSRFYSTKENSETLAKVARGEIDIIIGTHRLLSRDVTFKDLGLVIVDEEHRFGVKQKERLKQLKKQVDVLTLTATPIPRTLYMSLLGIRDVSVISTAPHDRRVIRTYVAANSDSLIRDAIMREIDRGGQVFFLHNRVQSIDLCTARLAQIVPEARFAFGHGQMSEQQLEKIMHSFLRHEIDVLVSTTIIESGLDIPNANTIIVERADTFGLAQLYQIRGRVGRSTKQAYAYLLIPKGERLSVDAERRLSVLQSLDDLGLGFNLALRDLEIRGAGNLLGQEQSGNVAAVGFELYTKILREAVLNLKGEQIDLDEDLDPEVNLGMTAFIPEPYIPDISERLVLYQRLAALTDEAEGADLALEIEDRFGGYGFEMRNLIELMRFKFLLKQLGVQKLELSAGKITVYLSPRAPIDGDKIAQLVIQDPQKFRFTKHMVFTLSLGEERFDSPIDVEEFMRGVFEPLRRA